MKEIGTVKIHCLTETKTPLTHMMGTSGNESIINREKVCHNGTIKDVPVISGNAIRHRVIREPGAMHLVDALDLCGKLNIDQANYMFTGGSLTESSTNENLKRIAEMQQLFPLFRILGGSLKNQVIGGSLIVLRGIMICEENREVLESILPDGCNLPSDELKSCDEYISDYQYTRGDAKNRPDAGKILETLDIESEKSNLMIYNGQTIVPGALFYHGFYLINVSMLEVGAVLNSIESWSNSGSNLGGYSRIGHGIVDTKIYIEDANDFYDNNIDFEKYITSYREHVIKNKEKCIEWLNDNFSSKNIKEKKK